jgi:queuine tRNA-ribosyltransferase
MAGANLKSEMSPFRPPEVQVKFGFEVLREDRDSAARVGILHTAHGDIETPAFMPVGTAATVKALPHEWLEAIGCGILLSNTYHLYLRPGHERIARLGGLHRFMSWPRAILTDSGGFQVFSHRDLRRISEEGVFFQSHLDGSRHFLSPEKVMEVQIALAPDIAMVFDECTPYPCSLIDAERSMELSMRWAERCREYWQKAPEVPGGLFGIVQGSTYPDLRARSVGELLQMGFDGIAIGGLSVGEPKDLMMEVISATVPLLPQDQPRYLMGVGTPEDLVRCVAQGIDLFDCVLPTRNARNGCLFTSSGRILIKNSAYAEDERPVDPKCSCLTCRRYSRAYLRHLFMAGEYLAATLNTIHNVSFYLDRMSKIRESIRSNSYGKWLEGLEKQPE